MADTLNHAFFYNSENGDRVYDADSFEHWLKKFFTTGVFSGELRATANNDMTITIGSGYCNVDGKVRFFSAEQTITLENAHASYDRIDNVVIERNDADRDITAKIVMGGYSTNPVAPDPVRTNGVYQIVVARIRVNHGAVMITQADITDTRSNADICGIVAGTVKELDFSTMRSQFESYFDQQKEDFDEWFSHLQDVLDGDVAANLQQQITAHETKFNNQESEISANTDAITALEEATRDLIADWTEAGRATGTGASKFIRITPTTKVHEICVLVQMNNNVYLQITLPSVALGRNRWFYYASAWPSTNDGYIQIGARRNDDETVQVFLQQAFSGKTNIGSGAPWFVYWR